MFYIKRGYMYNPDISEVIITEIYYNFITKEKLGSNMKSFPSSVLSPNIIKKLKKRVSKSYTENIQVNEYNSSLFLYGLSKFKKSQKLYFEYKKI